MMNHLFFTEILQFDSRAGDSIIQIPSPGQDLQLPVPVTAYGMETKNLTVKSENQHAWMIYTHDALISSV